MSRKFMSRKVSRRALLAGTAAGAASPAHFGPADCCGGYGWGGYGGGCGGMYFHDGYWYDRCGNVLTQDPNSWPRD